jgi:hypothetical protein
VFKPKATKGSLSLRCKAKRRQVTDPTQPAPAPATCGAEVLGKPIEPSSIVALDPSDVSALRRRKPVKPIVTGVTDCEVDYRIPLGRAASKRLQAAGETELQRVITAKIGQENLEYFCCGRTLCVNVAFDGPRGVRNQLYLLTFP